MKIFMALAKKEFYQIVRDPSSIMIAFILPFMFILLFAFGISLDSNKFNVGLLVQDNSVDAQNFAAELKHNRFYNVKVGSSMKVLERELIAGKIRGIITIPPDFSERLNNPDRKVQIYVIADGAEPNIANSVKSYANGIFMTWLSGRPENVGIKKPLMISVEQRYWYNQDLKSRNFILPGSLAIIMTLIGTLLTALVIAREWERGTMELILTSKASKLDFLLSKYIPYLFLGIVSMVFCLFVCTVIFNVPFKGSFSAYIMVSGLFLLTSLGQGLFISTVTRDQFLASQYALVSGFLPAIMLSGLLYPICTMPKIIQFITIFIPAKYFVSCIINLFMAGTIWGIILPNSIFLLIIALLLFVLIYHVTPEGLK